jgi:hypothetical protein
MSLKDIIESELAANGVFDIVPSNISSLTQQPQESEQPKMDEVVVTTKKRGALLSELNGRARSSSEMGSGTTRAASSLLSVDPDSDEDEGSADMGIVGDVPVDEDENDEDDIQEDDEPLVDPSSVNPEAASRIDTPTGMADPDNSEDESEVYQSANGADDNDNSAPLNEHNDEEEKDEEKKEQSPSDLSEKKEEDGGDVIGPIAMIEQYGRGMLDEVEASTIVSLASAIVETAETAAHHAISCPDDVLAAASLFMAKKMLSDGNDEVDGVTIADYFGISCGDLLTGYNLLLDVQRRNTSASLNDNELEVVEIADDIVPSVSGGGSAGEIVDEIRRNIRMGELGMLLLPTDVERLAVHIADAAVEAGVVDDLSNAAVAAACVMMAYNCTRPAPQAKLTELLLQKVFGLNEGHLDRALARLQPCRKELCAGFQPKKKTLPLPPPKREVGGDSSSSEDDDDDKESDGDGAGDEQGVDDEPETEEEDTGNNPCWIPIHGGDLAGIMQRQVAAMGIRPLVICLQDGQEPDVEALNTLRLSSDDVKRIRNKYVLVRMTAKAMRQPFFRENGKYMSSKDLQPYNHRKVVLGEREYVVPIIHEYEHRIQLWASLDPPTIDTAEIDNMRNLFAICNEHPDSHSNEQLTDIWYRQVARDYWTDRSNCFFTLTYWFKTRRFEYKQKKVAPGAAPAPAEVDEKEPKADGETLGDGRAEEPQEDDNDDIADAGLLNEAIDKGRSNYLEMLCRRSVYVDGSYAVNYKGGKLYEPKPNIPVAEEFNKHFSAAKTSRDRFHVLSAYLLNPATCHIVTDREILLAIKSTVQKYLPIVKYVWGYAWLPLYIEECMTRTAVLETDRFVFTLDAACELPFFPWCDDDVHLNPYNTLLVAKSELNSQTTTLGARMIVDWDGYGLATPEQYERNFRIYCTSNPDIDLFEGVDWENIGITGSTMTACLPKRHPMSLRYKTATNTWDQAVDGYMKSRYTESPFRSDLDIMVYSESIFEFMGKAYGIVNQVTDNAIKHKLLRNKKAAEVSTIKSLHMFVSVAYLRERLPGLSFQQAMEKLQSPEVRQHFYRLYVNLKMDNNEMEREEMRGRGCSAIEMDHYEKHWDLVEMKDMNILLTQGYLQEGDQSSYGDMEYYVRRHGNILPCDRDAPRGTALNAEENPILLKITEGFKIKLLSPKLNHDLEIFRIKTPKMLPVVIRFHKPGVRAYMTRNNDGKLKVLILPSCISTRMMFNNVDYKYFAGTKDPLDICSKNRFRWDGYFSNEHEKTDLVPYIKKNAKWKEASHNLGRTPAERAQLFGSLTVFNNGIEKASKNCPNEKPLEYVQSSADLQKWYEKNTGYSPAGSYLNVINMKTINDEGRVEPVDYGLVKRAFAMVDRMVPRDDVHKESSEPVATALPTVPIQSPQESIKKKGVPKPVKGKKSSSYKNSKKSSKKKMPMKVKKGVPKKTVW